MPSLRIFVLFFMFLAYFLPTGIAVLRDHRNQLSIFLLNLFVGWTFIGWIAALVWSAANDSKGEVVVNTASVQQRSISSEIMELASLRDSGALTEEEFQAEKQRIFSSCK